MRRQNFSRKILVLGLVATLSISLAAGVDPDISFNYPTGSSAFERVILSNQDATQKVNVSVDCGSETIQEIGVKKVGTGAIDSSVDDSFSSSKDTYTYSFSSPDLSEYRVYAQCENSGGTQTGSSSKGFYIDRLNFTIKEPESEGTVSVGTMEEVIIKPSFQLTSLDKKSVKAWRVSLKPTGAKKPKFLAQDDSRSYLDNSRLKLKVNIPDIISSEESGGKLKIAMPFLESNDNRFEVVNKRDVVISRWRKKVTVYPDDKISVEELDTLSIGVSELRWKGQPVSEIADTKIQSDNFYIKDGEREVFELSKSGDVYNLTLEPTADIDNNTEFTVMFDHEDVDGTPVELATISVTSSNNFVFDGRIIKSNLGPVRGSRILLKNGPSSNREIKTGENGPGTFSEQIKPGVYDVTFNFPPVSPRDKANNIHLRGVELENKYYTKFVKYDYFSSSEIPSNLDIEGVKPVNLMAFHFGYPFSSGNVVMSYTPSPDNPSNVDVFRCAEWKFGEQRCARGHEWKKIEESKVSLNPFGWQLKRSISFPIARTPAPESYSSEKETTLGAYVIGTNSKLTLGDQLTLPDDRVTMGEKFKMNGRILTGTGGAVEGAEVTASLLDQSGDAVDEFSAETSEDGSFEITGTAPAEPANLTFEISAEKPPYEPLEQELDETLWVHRKKEISVSVPDRSFELYPGETSTFEFQVSNSGQVKVEKVEVGVDGLGVPYQLSRTDIGTLDVGETASVDLNITVPTDYCQGSCRYPSFDFKAVGYGKGTRLGAKENVQTTVVAQSSSKESSTEDSQKDGGGNLQAPNVAKATGEFLASQSSLNIALGLIVIFTMVLAGAVKKKKSSDGDRDRRRMMAGNMKNGGREARAQMVQKPDVSGREDEVQREEAGGRVKEKVDEIADALENGHEDPGDAAEGDASGDSDAPDDGGTVTEEDETEAGSEPEEDGSGDFVCDTCGESFDTASGLEVHEKAIHE